MIPDTRPNSVWAKATGHNSARVVMDTTRNLWRWQALLILSPLAGSLGHGLKGKWTSKTGCFNQVSFRDWTWVELIQELLMGGYVDIKTR
jgi:hypothetical protein